MLLIFCRHQLTKAGWMDGWMNGPIEGYSSNSSDNLDGPRFYPHGILTVFSTPLTFSPWLSLFQPCPAIVPVNRAVPVV